MPHVASIIYHISGRGFGQALESPFWDLSRAIRVSDLIRASGGPIDPRIPSVSLDIALYSLEQGNVTDQLAFNGKIRTDTKSLFFKQRVRPLLMSSRHVGP